ncbi:MAG: aminotransferase class I/II-fold pyridoxal phosphate-dependent enzyme [Candidatus Andersenbacteria bacterium]
MRRPIAISLSPNTESDDIRQAHRVLWHPQTWKDTTIFAEVSSALSAWFGGVSVALTSSGRQALYDLLKATGIGQGDEVIIQAFTCIAVPEPILWAQATPVYADVIPYTYNLDPASVSERITEKTKAIIVQHTFGIPGPIQELQAIAREHNLLLIEDCAHALGGTYNNQPLGTFGDAAILSFGRDKALSSVFGGAVISRNQQLIHTIHKYAQDRRYPPSRWIIQQLLHPILFHILVSLYFTGGMGKVGLVLAQRLGLLSKAVATEERSGRRPDHFSYRYSPALAHLLHLQVHKLKRYTQRRRDIAQRYIDELKETVTLPSVPEGGSPNWLRMPIGVKDTKKLRRLALQQEMMLGDWYDAPLVPSGSSLSTFKYMSGSCPNAEEAAKHVINLPTYPLLTDKQVDHVIELVKNQEASSVKAWNFEN